VGRGRYLGRQFAAGIQPKTINFRLLPWLFRPFFVVACPRSHGLLGQIARVRSAGGTCGAQDGRNLGTQGHLCPGNGIDQQGAGGTHSSCFGVEQIDLAPMVPTQIHWVTRAGNSILNDKLTCHSSQSLASFIIGGSHLRRAMAMPWNNISRTI
jgi:hypothetical protein